MAHWEDDCVGVAARGASSWVGKVPSDYGVDERWMMGGTRGDQLPRGAAVRGLGRLVSD